MARAARPGINPNMRLAKALFEPSKLAQAPTRDGYGDGVVDAGTDDPNIMVLCADLTESTRSLGFKKAFPDRFVQIGVSEQSLAAIAAGLALAGKVPFIASYAGFSPGRNWEQIRTTIALNNTNVKIMGAHAGVSVGPDGATHQMVEDIAIMRVMPNMRVSVPCDSIETKKATLAAAKAAGPAYIRFGREKSPIFTTPQTPYQIGRAEVFRFGNDVTIVAAGPLLYQALVAAETLARKGVQTRVIDCHSIKPLDVKTLVAAAKETGAVVTIEEAQAAGGLGGAVAECLGSFAPVPIERIGMPDRFGESGEPNELLEAFGLTAPYIQMAVERALARKAGRSVSPVPEYVTAAVKRLATMQKQTMGETLARAPKKWGGTKSEASLKSRKTT